MSDAFAFSASFAWCSGSPSFALTDVPQGTARLQFAMTDLNVPSFHHGGGTVAYSGQTAVPCGDFSSGFTGVAAAGPGPHLPVHHQGARFERRSAGNDHDAAQVSRVTIAQHRK
jgi:hypothetical protein